MEGQRPAGFWIRVAAMLVDIVLFAFVQFSLGVVATLAWARSVDDSPVFQIAIVLFTALFTAVYFTALESLGGQTLGKLATGVRVVTVDGETPTIGVALLRYFAYYASALAFFLGFVMVGLRRDKRGFHDLIAGTRVERVRRARRREEPEEPSETEPATPSALE